MRSYFHAVPAVLLVGVVVGLSACSEQSPSSEPATGGMSGSAAASGGMGGSSGGSGGSAGGTAFSCTSTGAVGKTVAVPSGEFVMGCNASVDSDCLDDERPMRTVFVSAFEIDETEVTQDQFAACFEAGACAPPKCEWDCNAKDNPASCVTWDDAKSFCAWAGKRLPTEAEWEKAARGTDGRKYPWGNTEPSCAEVNMSGCGEHASAAGSCPQGKSPFGALDMAGNVVEMVADWYDAAYYQSGPTTDPKGPTVGERYVGRGGGYKSKPLWQRASSRDWYDLEDFGRAFGFRCAR